jgi:NAD(P)H-hydrate epimerase
MDVKIGGWSLDQLMELAGLSVSQAGKLSQASNIQLKILGILTPQNVVWRMHPLSQGKNVLVVCGPGNNGMRS